jgi:hypothetical protein
VGAGLAAHRDVDGQKGLEVRDLTITSVVQDSDAYEGGTGRWPVEQWGQSERQRGEGKENRGEGRGMKENKGGGLSWAATARARPHVESGERG